MMLVTGLKTILLMFGLMILQVCYLTQCNIIINIKIMHDKSIISNPLVISLVDFDSLQLLASFWVANGTFWLMYTYK